MCTDPLVLNISSFYKFIMEQKTEIEEKNFLACLSFQKFTIFISREVERGSHQINISYLSLLFEAIHTCVHVFVTA